jgi:L-threonylcarbamoyladenylate synthase
VASTESSSPSDREAHRPTGGQAFLPVIIRPREIVLSEAELDVCRKAFGRGGLIAFPTDTVYGVGADAGNPEAVRRLFEAKRRPPDKALPVLVPGREGVILCARDVPEVAWRLMDAFWPGPLTIVLRRTEAVCRQTAVGADTVGLRMPNHPTALQVLRAVEGPLAVTSANLSGEENTVSSTEVLATLGRALDVLIEDRASGTGVPSTVIDLTQSPPRVLRQGAVALGQLQSVIGEVASS